VTVDEQRAAVVAEARTWLNTPYHHAARCKGAGVDYPPDWHLHRDVERYLEVVTGHAREVAAPTGPGDFVLYRWGRCFAHGAIIVGWPEIIHALIDVGVVLDLGEAGRLAGRDRRFFTLWPRGNRP
jgi:cell wall-associated NlpC family hydrolase